MLENFFKFINILIYTFLFGHFLAGSAVLPDVKVDLLTEYTREIKYNFVKWTVDAAWVKLQQAAISSPHYLGILEEAEIVSDYFSNMHELLYFEWELEQIYADPTITAPESASQELRERLDALYAREKDLAPFAESVLEAQVGAALAESGLGMSGQLLPPPLYHISPLPTALIISPRDTIRRDRQIMLLAEFPVDEQNELEEKIFETLNLSALVVPVGGVGNYPTMGMRTANLPWTIDTLAHEWTHNYLFFFPLGANYEVTPEVRIINETVASIVGGEVSQMVVARYYPEYLSVERPRFSLVSLNGHPPAPLPQDFDFRAEMHETRVHADALLAAGKIEEAEAYMEERRQYMWENGYAIRKLNQAYFAFHGAYADLPGGAAGEDPVGPAVRKLREQSDSLADFLETIRWVETFDELLALVDA